MKSACLPCPKPACAKSPTLPPCSSAARAMPCRAAWCWRPRRARARCWRQCRRRWTSAMRRWVRDWVGFGEIGLAGEGRPVQRGQERIREAAKLGFKRAVLPAANMPKKGEAGIELIAVKRLDEALDAVLSGWCGFYKKKS